jgi:type VI secretion system secreted protein Hcp
MFMRPFIAAAAAVAVLLSTSAASALEGTLTTEGTKQKFATSDRVSGLKYDVKTPRDAASGMATGRRQHGAVCIYKPASATTPQYFQALTTNEALKSVTFDATNGLRLKLTNAVAVSFAIVGTDGKDVEEVCFTFQKIEIAMKGMVAADDRIAP